MLRPSPDLPLAMLMHTSLPAVIAHVAGSGAGTEGTSEGLEGASVGSAGSEGVGGVVATADGKQHDGDQVHIKLRCRSHRVTMLFTQSHSILDIHKVSRSSET